MGGGQLGEGLFFGDELTTKLADLGFAIGLCFVVPGEEEVGRVVGLRDAQAFFKFVVPGAEVLLGDFLEGGLNLAGDPGFIELGLMDADGE